MKELRKEIRSKARLLRGLVNVFQLDADYIWSDSNNYDIMCLGESLAESRMTSQQIIDCLSELEYLLYLAKKKES